MADKARAVLLAEKWADEDPTGWWLSEKLDGVRAYFTGSTFYSRLGNKFPAPQWFIDGMPKQPLDGELWCGRGQFQKCVGIVKSSSRQDEWKYVTYLAFDAPQARGPFEERYASVKKACDAPDKVSCAAVGMVKCKGKQHLLDELKRVEAAGGEGLMLRQPKSEYEWRRSKTLLKVKTFFDEEAIVIGHEPGKGRHTGRMGALRLRTPDGREFSVGSGFNDKQRNRPPKKGAIVSYRFQELSQPPSLKPRFPTFICERIDIDWDDYCKSYVRPDPAKRAAPSLKRQHTILYSNTPSGRVGPSDDTSDAMAAVAAANAAADDADDDDDDNDDDNDNADADLSADGRLKCRFGATCYRKSEHHKTRFWHPPLKRTPLPKDDGSSAAKPDAPAAKKARTDDNADDMDLDFDTEPDDDMPAPQPDPLPVPAETFASNVCMVPVGDPDYDATPIYLGVGATTLGRGVLGLANKRLSRAQVVMHVKAGVPPELEVVGMNKTHVTPTGGASASCAPGTRKKLADGDEIALLDGMVPRFKVRIMTE